jgi:membrane protease subunit (stomatin/prohibitin family)
MPIAAANEGAGGTAALGAQLGIGVAMAHSMAGAFNQPQGGAQPQPPSGGAPVPPVAPAAGGGAAAPGKDTKFCIECGSSMPARAKFCPGCGAGQS